MADASGALPAIRLKALLWVFLAVAMLLFVAAAWRGHDASMEAAEETAGNDADLLQQHALQMFEALDLAAKRVNERIQGMSWEDISTSELLRRDLGEIQDDFPQVAAIWLIDSVGVIRNAQTVPAPLLAGFARNGRGETSEAKSRVIVQTLGNATSFGTVIPRSSPDIRGAGSIAVIASHRYFASLWQRLPRNSTVTLLKPDGVVLAQSHSAQIALSNLPPLSPLALAVAHARPASFPASVGSDGVQRVHALRTLRGGQIVLLYGLPVASALAHWRRLVIFYGVLYLLVAAALVLTGALLSRRIRGEERAWQQAIAKEIHERASVELALRQAQKMEVVGQLASGMAHDFGNLLSGIALHLSMLEKRGVEPRQSEPAIRAAIHGVDQGTRLVRSLLAFARREAPKFETLDVNEAVTDMAGLLRQCLEPHSKLVLDLAPGAWTVSVDARLMQLALLNLAINARDAMPSGGTLRIVTRNLTLRGEHSGSVGDHLVLQVIDTGTGMQPAVLARASEPFFTTKPVGAGTGLGLHQVAHFAKTSSGSFTISSELGKGTTVTIYLPRSCASRSESRTAAQDVAHGRVWRVRPDAKTKGLILGEAQRRSLIEAGQRSPDRSVG